MENNEHFCGNPDYLGIRGNCKWQNFDKITWSFVGSIPNLTQEQALQAFTIAWSYWEEVCNIKTVYTNDPTNAMIIITSGNLDGPTKVLAWSDMPCNINVNQLKQKYDSGENWTVSETPASNKIDLVRVAAHEIGHAIGIPHIQNGNLMAPTYNVHIRRPQKADIDEAIGRYGPADLPPPIPDDPNDPPTPPNPNPVSWWKVIFQIIYYVLKVIADNTKKTFGGGK